MLKRIFAVFLCLMPLASPLQSQDISDALSGLPQSLIDELKKPDRFLEDTTALIMGYGQNARIDRNGVMRYIEAQRAATRARELRRLLSADLNDDLNVTEQELMVLVAAASATGRGRLLLRFRATDSNSDGLVEFFEMRRHAQFLAEDALTAEDAQALYDLFAFDTNDDGFLSLDEVVRNLRGLGFEA